MGENIEQRIVHGPDDPLSLFVAWQFEAGMDRTEAEIEALQDGGRKVELAVSKNVDFAGFEDCDAGNLVIQPVD